jgi:succinyl-CoA synthetase beta subunit
MQKVDEIIRAARQRKQNTLSEHESKCILSAYDIPVVKETVVRDSDDASEAASRIGYPVVLKFCSPEITHKTEHKLIQINLRNEVDLKQAFQKLEARAKRLKGDFLIEEMITDKRELIIGMIRDHQFGPCVMFGLGGIFTEALNSVSFRVAPVEERQVLAMMREVKGHEILDAVRGMHEVHKETLSESIISLGKIGLQYEDIQEIDVNPLMIKGNQPVAADALITLREIETDLPT